MKIRLCLKCPVWWQCHPGRFVGRTVPRQKRLPQSWGKFAEDLPRIIACIYIYMYVSRSILFWLLHPIFERYIKIYGFWEIPLTSENGCQKFSQFHNMVEGPKVKISFKSAEEGICSFRMELVSNLNSPSGTMLPSTNMSLCRMRQHTLTLPITIYVDLG